MRLQRFTNGERISVSQSDLIGSGGEAQVFLVPPDHAFVAKVYHRPTESHLRKLRVMLASPPENPSHDASHTSIAWPFDLLSMAYGEREFVGYLMPRAPGMRPLFQVYNPGARRAESPFVDYVFLHRAARNLAGAVRALHHRGYVIGDVNESNILVSRSALITLVDTDSFQVTDAANGTVFRCPVGKGEYTPPELQGKRFTAIDRAREHDLFGLAVLLFQLLMEGTHPFAGQYIGTGDSQPYESRILRGYFPYGNRRVPYVPAPTAPGLDLLHPELRQLFLRCFEDGHTCASARPDAQTWQSAIAAAERALIPCRDNPRHQYGSHSEECPWCARRRMLGGRDPFPDGSVANEPPIRYVPAASLLPRFSSAQSTGSASAARPPSASSGGSTPVASSWQMNAPIAASVSGGVAAPALTPTLFSFKLEGTLWTWCGAFWAALALASAPLGLPNLNLMMILLSAACAAAAWRSRRQSAPSQRWIGAGTALAAVGSLALRPIPAAPLAGLEPFASAPGPVLSLNYSADGAKLVSGTGRLEDASLTPGEVDIWDAHSRQIVSIPEKVSGDVASVSFSPDGRSLLCATNTPFGAGEVVLLDTNASGDYRSVFKSRARICKVAWAPDGRRFAIGSADRLVRVWDSRSLQLLETMEAPCEVATLAYSPDGGYLAVACRSRMGSVAPGVVLVWNTRTWQCAWSKAAHGNGAQALAFSPDSRQLATGGNDGAICLWDTKSGRLLRRQTAHSYGITALAFAPSGGQFASAETRQTESGIQNEIVVRDATTAAPLHTSAPTTDTIQALAFSPREPVLVSGSRDGSIRLWQIGKQ